MESIKRRTVAVAVALLACGWATSARADDQHKQHSETKHKTKDATGATETKTSTTTTTSSDLDVAPAGAERREAMTSGPNRTLLVTGGAVFAGSYLTSGIIGSVNDRDADKRLWIPVVGPWADLADRQCDQRPCDHKFWSATLLVASGVLQAGGLATALASFFVPESETPGLLEPKSTRSASVHVLPMTMGAGASAAIGAVGRF